MDLITYALCKKHGGESITYTLTADTENKTIVLTPSEGTAQVITVPYATDASTVNGHEVPELENGKIPANFLPSFVDNVDEYDSISLFPVVGESNRIYIDKSTNKTYRWSGTAYVEISESIALGETSSTAYRGDRGKIAYDHSQSAHAPSNAEANQNAFSNVKIDSDTINASAKTDTLEFIAGDNIILTPNVSNKKITVSQVPVRKTASGDIASFSDGTGDPFLEVKVNIEPVQSGSGDPSPSNVRPISGWSGANVARTGKNILSINEVYGNKAGITINNNVATGNNVSFSQVFFHIPQNLVGKQLTLSTKIAVPNSVSRVYSQAIVNNVQINGNDILSDTTGVTSVTFTPESTEDTFRITYGSGNGIITVSDFQVEIGSTATTYEPYQGSTLSIPFHDSSDNPITVYGGRLNVTTGELRVDRATITIDGVNKKVKSWGVVNNGYGVYYVFDVSRDKIKMCDKFTKTDANRSKMELYTYIGSGGTDNTCSFILPSTVTTVDEANVWFSENPTTILYELATPQTYQLTPTQVTTLLGQNNIFADCGQIEVAYKTPFYNDLTTKNEVQVLINESITSALNASY